MKRLLLIIVFLLVSFSLYAQNFWVSTNGPFGGSVRSLAINSSGHIFAGTYGSGVYRSTDNGSNWTQVSNSFRYSKVYSLAINSSGYIFAGTFGDGVFRSTDNGNNWTQINSGLTNINILSLLINSSGYILAGTNGNGIFISTNNGTNWTMTNSPGYSCALGRNSKANSAIFAVTKSEIYRSTNDGYNWTRMFRTFGFGEFTSLAVNNNDNIFAGNTYYYGVYRSTDNGNNWTQINNGAFATTHVYSLAINGSEHIFAGTQSDGIFRSTDNGNNWIQINSGLTDNYIPSLAINSSGYIFAGTNGNGVFRSLGTTTSVKESGENIPTKFSLSQNYPNPFNPSTTIKFALPERAKVNLSVYNLLGEKIAELVNGELTAGYHEVELNASNLSSGIYFYELTAGKFREVKKMILLR